MVETSRSKLGTPWTKCSGRRASTLKGTKVENSPYILTYMIAEFHLSSCRYFSVLVDTRREKLNPSSALLDRVELEKHWVARSGAVQNRDRGSLSRYSMAELPSDPALSFARCPVGPAVLDVMFCAKRSKLSGSPAKPAKHGRLSLARAASHSRRSVLLVFCSVLLLYAGCTHDDQTVG